MGQARAPMNLTGQLMRPGDAPQLTATQLVAAAGDSVPALATAMGIIAGRFEESVRSTDQLNRALADFKTTVMEHFRGELRFLRYNLGEKVNHTTTNLEVMVGQLDKVIWANLRAQGFSDEKIREFRIEHGMQPEAPSGPELEMHVQQTEELLGQIAALTAQNQRLMAQLSNVKHVEWPEDGKQYVYHQGCECPACKAVAQMNYEASGAARGA
jgi:hypothetical protein